MKVQVSLRTRFALLVIAAVVPLFGLSIVKAWLSADSAVERAMNNLRFGASLAAFSEQRVTEAAHQLLAAIANTPDVRDGKADACSRYLYEMHQLFPVYLNLGIVGLDGYPLCNGASPSRREYLGDRAYFREAMDRRSFVAGGYIVGRLTGKPAVTFAYPALDSKGNVAYVAYAALDLSEMGRVLASVELPPSASLGIHDRNGILLAGTANLPIKPGQKAGSGVLLEAVKDMTAGVREGSDRTGRQRLWAFAPSSLVTHTAFLVAVSIDRDLVVGPSQRELLLELAVLLLVAFLGFWIAWMMGNRLIVQPTAAILEAIRKLQTGKLDVRIPIQATGPRDELSSIAYGVNLMVDSLEQLQLNQAGSYAELRETQSRLLGAQRLGRIGNWEMDLVTRQLSWSDAMYPLYGLQPGTFDGRFESFMQMFHPDDREVYAQRLEAALRDGTELETEYRIITPDGDVRWMHQLGKLYFDDAGQPVCRTGVVQDITARKRAELALAKSVDLLHRTGEMAKVGGWELILDGMHLTCSDQVLRIHDQAPGTPFSAEDARNSYPPEARAIFVAACVAAIEQGIPWDLELPLLTATGRAVWVRTQGQAFRQHGKVHGLVGALQDITVQHESQEHWRLLGSCISRLNDMVMIAEVVTIGESDRRIVFVNNAFEHQTGYRLEDVLGRSPALLNGPKTQPLELERIAVALKAGQPVSLELINYTKIGDEFWSEVDIASIADAKGQITHSVSVSRDITQRKLAEQALMDSEQRYAALFQQGPAPMWVDDLVTGRFLMVNNSAVQAYGYTTEEFLSMTIFDIRPESEYEALRDHMLADDPGRKESWQHKRKDGSHFTVNVVSKRIQYAGRAARFVVALDMSAQVNAEKETREHLFTLQRAADATQAITWHQTLDGMLQEVAEQARGVIGAHQALVGLTDGRDWSQITSALSLSDKYARYRDLIEPPDGTGIYALVCEKNHAIRLTQAELEAHPRWRGFGNYADKHPTMRGWLAVPLTSRTGRNIGLLQLSDKYEGEFTLQDEYVAIELAQLASIAIENARLLEQVNQLNAGLERKVTERTAALSRQEALFRALADQAPHVVWTVNSKGESNYRNRAWLELVGGKPEDWDGLKWLSTVHPDDLPEVLSKWKVAAANLLPYVSDRRMLSRDGTYHSMSAKASPVLDDNGDLMFWVGIDADVTEIKGIEDALRLSNQELEAFSYSVSHDLRSPLNTVEGFSRLLAKQLTGDLAAKGQHYLSRIQAGVAQMGGLIEDLLSLSQVSRMQLRHESIDLSALSKLIVEEWRVRQPDRHVVVKIHDGLQAHGDVRLVRLVMENLLGNAWKFTSQKAEAHIEVGQTPDAAGVPVFFVRDNGAGFDMAYADKLFVAFQRLHTTTEFPGTGIGLATAGRAIARHGGRLWAEASPGIGATLFFTLPKLRPSQFAELID